MKSRTKQALIFAILILVISLGVYIATYEGKFMVEFGDSVEARNEFIKLLTGHNITSHTETDHLDRVWVVPDQAKMEEYEKVLINPAP
jgi:hypothetical protein